MKFSGTADSHLILLNINLKMKGHSGIQEFSTDVSLKSWYKI